MHSKYDNIHKNEMFYVLIYINNHIIISINCILSATWRPHIIVNSINDYDRNTLDKCMDEISNKTDPHSHSIQVERCQKKILNSPILISNHELECIEVNKGV